MFAFHRSPTKGRYLGTTTFKSGDKELSKTNQNVLLRDTTDSVDTQLLATIGYRQLKKPLTTSFLNVSPLRGPGIIGLVVENYGNGFLSG